MIIKLYKEELILSKKSINLVSDSVPINLIHTRGCAVLHVHYLRLLHATLVVLLDWLERFEETFRRCASPR